MPSDQFQTLKIFGYIEIPAKVLLSFFRIAFLSGGQIIVFGMIKHQIPDPQFFRRLTGFFYRRMMLFIGLVPFSLFIQAEGFMEHPGAAFRIPGRLFSAGFVSESDQAAPRTITIRVSLCFHAFPILYAAGISRRSGRQQTTLIFSIVQLTGSFRQLFIPLLIKIHPESELPGFGGMNIKESNVMPDDLPSILIPDLNKIDSFPYTIRRTFRKQAF